MKNMLFILLVFLLAVPVLAVDRVQWWESVGRGVDLPISRRRSMFFVDDDISPRIVYQSAANVIILSPTGVEIGRIVIPEPYAAYAYVLCAADYFDDGGIEIVIGKDSLFYFCQIYPEWSIIDSVSLSSFSPCFATFLRVEGRNRIFLGGNREIESDYLVFDKFGILAEYELGTGVLDTLYQDPEPTGPGRGYFPVELHYSDVDGDIDDELWGVFLSWEERCDVDGSNMLSDWYFFCMNDSSGMLEKISQVASYHFGCWHIPDEGWLEWSRGTSVYSLVDSDLDGRVEVLRYSSSCWYLKDAFTETILDSVCMLCGLIKNISFSDGRIFSVVSDSGVLKALFYNPLRLITVDTLPLALTEGVYASYDIDLDGDDEYIVVTPDSFRIFEFEITTGIDEGIVSLPDKTSISVYPNPFNSSVRIDAPAGSTIEIYNIKGEKIAVIPADKSGLHQWTPDKPIGSGVYLICSKVGSKSLTERVVYLK